MESAQTRNTFKLQKGDGKIALLIDPDWAENTDWFLSILSMLNQVSIDLILVGGSLIKYPDRIDQMIVSIKKACKIPVYLFPGHPTHLSSKADGVLFLSVISGRNPELLIGQHVVSAPLIKSYGLHVWPTGYMIIGNSATSVHYMSQTFPIPSSKPTIASATALAGEMLGLKTIYIDGGSGAGQPISEAMISEIAKSVSIPLIVGGGINNVSQLKAALNCGADMVVIGTAVEKTPEFLRSFQNAFKING